MSACSVVYSSPVGIIKHFTLKDRIPVTVSSLLNQNITSLCWHSDNSFLVGTKLGALYQQSCNNPSSECEPFDTMNEGVAAILGQQDLFLGVSTTGIVRSYDFATLHQQTETNLNTTVGVARTSPSLLAVGGKDSNLTVWDLNNSEKPVFTAKNVRPTTLLLEVPIWISDICFVPNYDGRIVLTTSRYGEICLYDIRCGQRRPVSRHCWRMSRKYGKVKVGTCSHGAMLPDLAVTRPITRGLAFADAPGVGVRIVAGNAIGDLCFLDLRLPSIPVAVTSDGGDEHEFRPGKIKSRGIHAPVPPVGVRVLAGASGSITGLACGGAGLANSPFSRPTALFESQPIVVASSLDRFLRIYNRDTGVRLAKLYAKLPITSFLISDEADFSNVDQLCPPSEQKTEENVGEEATVEGASEDEEFDELWEQMEPIDDEAEDGQPKRKKTKRKRGN